MKSIEKTIGWPNALLITAALFLVIAFAKGLRPEVAMGSSRGMLATGCLIVGGFFAAMGIREFAGFFFNLDSRPWYGQRGACVYLMVITTVVNLIVPGFLKANPRINPLAPVFTPEVIFYAAYAFELIWVAILDWPAQPASYKPTSEPRRSTRRGGFKSVAGITNESEYKPSAFQSHHQANRTHPEY